mgnify:CR=1 FL=1
MALSAQQFIEQVDRLRSQGLLWFDVAEELGYSDYRSVLRRLQRLKERGYSVDDYSIDRPPSPHMDAEDLVQHRIKQFNRKKRYEEDRKLIPVHVHLDGPIGILHFGDPHVDDDGTDLETLRYHSDLTNEIEGLYGANIGDTRNNWVGRLARLYAEQSTSESEALVLAEWFLKRTRWLYLIGGNHDAWSGVDDPIPWIVKEQNALYESSEVRLGLKFPNGRECRINARHDFAGHSQWNPAHGVGKSIQLGEWDDIAICGHKHVSGYMILKSPTDGRVCHAIQIASYKIYDRYARERGFRDQAVSPAVVTVIDPYAQTNEGFVTVFHDVEKGVEFLQHLRAKAR